MESSHVAPDARDLHKHAGLPVSLLAGADPRLHFGDGVSAAPGEGRTAPELSSVLREPRTAANGDVLYRVYRNVALTETENEVNRRGLTFVVLAMRAGTIGSEWARTRGHVNSAAPGTSVPYPEVHEVWHGTGLLYVQKNTGPDAGDVAVIPLTPGDKAVVAPGWATLLCNVGDDPLVVGTWRASDCVTQTEALETHGGMAHHLLAEPGQPNGTRFVPNASYTSVPEPRPVHARELSDLGLRANEPMLTTFRSNPDYLRYMMRPQDYAHVWTRLYREES